MELGWGLAVVVLTLKNDEESSVLGWVVLGFVSLLVAGWLLLSVELLLKSDWEDLF